VWQYILIFAVLFFGATSFYFVYERFFKRIEKKDSKLYIEALKDLLNDNQEASFSKLRQVVTDDPSNIEAYLQLGQILRDNNKPDRALKVHKDLTLRGNLIREDKISILYQLVCDYLALDELNTAEEALHEIISLDSNHYWAHTSLLKLYEKSAQWDKAYDTAVIILKLESNKSNKPLARYKLYKGNDLFKKREYQKARVILKEAIGLDPTCIQAYLLLGDSYYEEKRLEDAVNFWRKLITAVPDQGHQVIDRLKKSLFELGRFGDIMEICSDILKHSPGNIEACLTQAEFYEKKGDLDLAQEVLEKVHDEFPEDNKTMLELTRIYLEKGDKARIDKLLRSFEKRRAQQENQPVINNKNS